MREKEIMAITDVAGAKYEIEKWLLNHLEFSLITANKEVIALRKECFAFTVEFHKLIFSYWTSNIAESYRVVKYLLLPHMLKITLIAPFGKPQTFEIWQVSGNQRLITEMTKEEFLNKFVGILKGWRSDLKVVEAKAGRSDRYSYQSAMVRLLLREGEDWVAGITVSEQENGHQILQILGQGLNWWLRLRDRKLIIKALYLFVPTGYIGTIAERLTMIKQERIHINLFEVDLLQQAIRAVTPFDQGDLGLWLRMDSQLPQNLGNRVYSSWMEERLAWMQSIVAGLEFRRGLITKVEINGLTLAHCFDGQHPRIEFGLAKRELLTISNEMSFIKLLQEVATYRRASSSNRQHPYYRASSEAWLEAVLKRNITVLDRELCWEFVYCQVPAVRCAQERFIDLLTIRRDGQLVVIELKVKEELELPFQGLDYWLRVEWHRKRNDFSRHGYFPGMLIKDSPAWLYLVAPRLRFHKKFLALTEMIKPVVPLFQIAINDNWREGLKLDHIERINGIVPQAIIEDENYC